MALNADFLLQHRFPTIEAKITDRDAMLYALSVGLAADPLDLRELRYAYEKDLETFATMPVVIGHPGDWMNDPRTGITRGMVVHGAQRLSSHKPLPLDTPLLAENRVAALLDKGADRGAIMVMQRTIREKGSGELLASMESQVFCRADGGFGGSTGVVEPLAACPSGAADQSATIPTAPNAALLYRLNQDRNPLHADPAVAARANFVRPILHGLATYGLAAVTVSRAHPQMRIRGFECRFAKPVFPGETIVVDMWRTGDELAFQARVAERDLVVLDHGRAQLDEPGGGF